MLAILKHFVSEQCGVEDYVISPVTKIAVSSLILEWYIPAAAVAHMIKIASSNKVNFIKNCFLYLKISSTLILECRDTVSALLYTYSYMECVDICDLIYRNPT